MSRALTVLRDGTSGAARRLALRQAHWRASLEPEVKLTPCSPAAIAVDHGKDGIRCNAIAPGWINSNLSEEYLDSMPDPRRIRSELKMMHPVGRLGEPEDVGSLAAWLASDESGFVTGQVFVVDGGRTKKLPLPIA